MMAFKNIDMFDIVPPSFSGLVKRHKARFPKQDKLIDILPSVDTDLEGLRAKIVDKGDRPAIGPRSDIKEHYLRLQNGFHGQSQLELLHALTISYLRRDTPHNKKALWLFRRIWEEQSEFLVDCLNARWLISALQTFYDYPANSGEKTAGAVGFMYGNLIKVYETERSACKFSTPTLPSDYKNQSVKGMFGFVPGDDILLHINVLAFDAVKSGGMASLPLLRLMEIISESDTIFRRTDSLSEVSPFSLHKSFTKSFSGRT